MQTEMIKENTTELNRVKKEIPGSTLKWIAIIAMFLDHFAAIFVNGYMLDSISKSSNRVDMWVTEHFGLYLGYFGLRLIGRFGFPLFAFLLVEGFSKTKHLARYIRNMVIFVVISEIPFNLGFSNKLFNAEYQSVFWTLLIGLLTLTGIKYLAEEREWSEKLSFLYYIGCAIAGGIVFYLVFTVGFVGELFITFRINFPTSKVIVTGVICGLILGSILGIGRSKQQKAKWIFYVLPVLAGVFLGEFFKTDYSGWGVFTIAVMYLLRKKPLLEMRMGCTCLTVMSPIEISAFLMMIPVKFYNGERGMKMKYFFYAFYPLHILLLYLVTYFMGLVDFAIR